ncbi:uncharacterized protein LOC111057086 [Nilaparvata lugens]|uniref:uncharacterized protein LOC111057086 n=1 Tax=Nilaparvata lugens TaxID=108931 RepID=UPI00193D878F|nr:uncharacterized protein LOC111057086 [Nilaparvata lugens]
MWLVRICRRIRRRHISVFFLALLLWGLVWLVWSVLLQHSSPSDRKLPARFTWNQQIVDMEPSVDNSSQPSDGQILIQLKKQLPSLPISFWHRNMNRGLFFNNNTCARYPDIFELEFNNLYWQSLRTTNGTFHLYGAYYDNRELSEIGPAVRILGMIDRIEPTVNTYCQIWFDHHRQPVFAEVMEYSHIWNKFWGNYEQGILQPYLMACQIPEEFQKLVPASVSIVEDKCDIAKNNLRVIYKKPYETKNFAVCVKGLDFSHSDLSVRLVEWIELLGILGADKVFFYQFKVHSNISKVLKYYKKRNRIEVTHLTLPGGQPNIPALRSLYLKKNR